jgi:adenosyl cobinamide kinase/adenosyl cobinamide phosphate guanylyltransferase
MKVIQDALGRYCPEDDIDIETPEYTMQMLSCVGGLDIAGLAGVFIGGAIYHIPVIIDGFISAVAALVAERLVPGTRNYMLASHQGKEPGMKFILEMLGLEPVIDGGLALGEGTGAVMLMPMLDTALALYNDGLSFDETEVSQYYDYESRPEGKMTTLIIGYPDSGKSAMAEKLVTEISEPDERIYLATMIPYGQAGAERVERHRKFRAGKGFKTVEAPFDIDAAANSLKETGGIELANMTVLLECVSNLVANELFERHASADELVEKLYMDIRHMAEQCRNLVIVTNHFEIEDSFDEETRMYAETLDILNEKLSKFADNTIRL